MKKITRILVPYDMSQAAKAALNYAIQFCKSDYDLEIHTLYVSNEEYILDAQEVSKDIYEGSASQKGYRGQLITHFHSGDLIESILEFQESHDIDLIIMGTNQTLHKEGEKTKTSELVLRADCPVIVVPKEELEFSLENIVIVIDRNEIDDTNTLNVLLAVAQRFNSKIHVLTIFRDEKEFEEDFADDKIENELEYHLGKFYVNHAFKKSDELLDAIFQFANDKEMDLLAILPRNHTVRTTPSKGKLTELLTLKTNIPLLAID